MIPIQSICGHCLSHVTAALESMQDKGETTLHGYCEHNQVALSLVIGPGGIARQWVLSPAASADEAKAMVEATLADAEFIARLNSAVLGTIKPSGGVN